jgi:thiol-disulfide isomerase/thioredoxin
VTALTPAARRIGFLVLASIAAETVRAEPMLHDFDHHTPVALAVSHAGKPYVLALWSVHCEPCRSELELLGEFTAAHPEIAIELVATDFLEDRPAAKAMLAEFELDGVRTWAFADDFAERIRYAIDPRWRGELPRLYLFDADHQPTAISGRVEADTLTEWRRGLFRPRTSAPASAE